MGIRKGNENEIIFAYEPIWAIGKGIPADKKNIDDALKIISIFLKEKKLKKIPLLYGGSVSSKNIEEIMSSDILSGCFRLHQHKVLNLYYKLLIFEIFF